MLTRLRYRRDGQTDRQTDGQTAFQLYIVEDRKRKDNRVRILVASEHQLVTLYASNHRGLGNETSYSR